MKINFYLVIFFWFMVVPASVFAQKDSNDTAHFSDSQTFPLKLDLLAQKNDKTIPASDFDLGPLFKTDIKSPQITQLVTEIVRPFCTNMVKGLPGKEFYLPEMADFFIQRWAPLFQKKGLVLTGFRLGVPHLTEFTAIFPVKLYSKMGYAIGNLYLINSEGKWFIEDLEMDEETLFETKKREAFIPASLYSPLP